MLRPIRELSQEEKSRLSDANARLCARRETLGAMKARLAKSIPVWDAGLLVSMLLGARADNPFGVIKSCCEQLVWADVEAADGVITEPLANAVGRGVYTIGKDGKRIPITEENWESTCNVATVDGHSFCRTRLFWDGKLFGARGRTHERRRCRTSG